MTNVDRIETIILGVQGKKPLTEKAALMEARDEYIKLYQKEPKQLRVSPKCFHDLRAFAERWEYPYGFDVKVDNNFEENQWVVCTEETKVYGL